MNELTTFQFGEDREIRTLWREGKPWFVAKDVCDILEIKNVTNALRTIDEDEKITLKFGDEEPDDPKIFAGSDEKELGEPSSYKDSPKDGGARFINIINLSGLFTLIFKSNKPVAKVLMKDIITNYLSSFFKPEPELVAPDAYGDALRKLKKLRTRINQEMPGYQGREKAGKYLSSAIQDYLSAENDLLMACDDIVISYGTLYAKVESVKALGDINLINHPTFELAAMVKEKNKQDIPLEVVCFPGGEIYISVRSVAKAISVPEKHISYLADCLSVSGYDHENILCRDGKAQKAILMWNIGYEKLEAGELKRLFVAAESAAKHNKL